MDHRLSDPHAPSTPLTGASAFEFEVPVTVWKADGAPEGKKRRIAGVVSTDAVDRQNERILQDGLNFDDFLNNGWFNDNHQQGTCDILGYPESVKRFKAGDALPDGGRAKTDCTWVEGYLLTTKKADAVWELARSLAMTTRRLGYSVEGNIEARQGDDGNVIAKAKVRNIAVTNCFPGSATVRALPEAISRRPYTGPMIHIELVTGEKLAGTPNHPVFTQLGWVSLGELDKGVHKVARVGGQAAGTASAQADVQNVPTSLEQIFAAAKESGLAERRVVRGEDFHGDGVVDSEVDVVTVEGKLRDDLVSVFGQKFGQNNLPTTEKVGKVLARFGALTNLLSRRHLTPPSDIGGEGTRNSDGGAKVGSSSQLFSSTVSNSTGVGDDDVDALSANAEPLSDVSASDAVSVQGNEFSDLSSAELFELVAQDASFLEELGDVLSGAAKDSADVGAALTAGIEFTHLVDVAVEKFSGHVYNLETSLGWYETQGVINSNCPVNTDSRLEILARSLTVHNQLHTLHGARKSMTINDASGSAGPAKAGRSYTEQGAGQVLSRESLDGARRKKRRQNTNRRLSRSEAVAYVKSLLPHASEALARALVASTKFQRGRGTEPVA